MGINRGRWGDSVGNFGLWGSRGRARFHWGGARGPFGGGNHAAFRINEILSILRDGLRAEISFLFVERDIRRRWSLQVMNANYERLTRVGQP